MLLGYLRDKSNRTWFMGWCCLGICLIGLAVFLTKRVDGLINSDASVELILAKHLFDTGQLISADWFYPTELRVLHEQVFFLPFFALFSDWHNVRVAGTLVLCLVLVVSFIFCCWQMGLKLLSPWLACILLLPFGSVYAIFVLFIPHLTLNMSEVFFVIGLVFLGSRDLASRRRILVYVIAAIVSFVMGLSGIRHIESFFVPLWLACLVSFHCCARSERSRKMLIVSSICLAAGILGCLTNMTILRQLYTWHSYSGVKWIAFDLQGLIECFQGLLEAYGYRENKVLLSLQGVANVISIAIFAGMVFSLWRATKSKRFHREEPIKVMAWLVIIGIALAVFIFSFTGMSYSPRYLLPYAIIALPVIAYVLKDVLACAFQTADFSRGRKSVVSAIVVLIALLPSGINYCDYLHTDNTKRLRMVASELVHDGRMQGYASYWNAGVLTELSNGEIETWALYPTSQDGQMNVDDVYAWSQQKIHAEESPNRPFILFSRAELESQNLAHEFEDAPILYENQGYVVYDYSSKVGNDGEL